MSTNETLATTTSITEYRPTEAKLAELASMYEGRIYEVATTAGMGLARVARADLRNWRVGLEKMRVEIKAPALDRCRQIDIEAQRITSAIIALEAPIDAQIKAEEVRKEAVREEKVRVETERIRAVIEAEAAKARAAEAAAMQVQREKLEREIALERAEQQRLSEIATAARIEADREAATIRAEDDRKAAAQRDADHVMELTRLAAEREVINARAEKLRIQEEELAADQYLRDQARIATATLQDAAHDAVELLRDLGYGEHVITRALAGALCRQEGASKNVEEV